MKKLSRRHFLLGTASVAAMANLKSCAIHKAAEHTGLSQAYKNDFLMGTAISNVTMEAPNKPLMDLIDQEINSITTENCMNSRMLQPCTCQWEWYLGDRIGK